MKSRDTPLTESKRQQTFVNKAMADEFLYDFWWAISRKKKLGRMQWMEICLSLHLYFKFSTETGERKNENLVVVSRVSGRSWKTREITRILGVQWDKLLRSFYISV